jgi:hypothetical protein
VSKRARIATLCRDQQDQAFKAAASTGVTWEPARVLNKCAVLLGVLAVILDEDDNLQNTTLYKREGRAFIKVTR